MKNNKLKPTLLIEIFRFLGYPFYFILINAIPASIVLIFTSIHLIKVVFRLSYKAIITTAKNSLLITKQAIFNFLRIISAVINRITSGMSLIIGGAAKFPAKFRLPFPFPVRFKAQKISRRAKFFLFLVLAPLMILVLLAIITLKDLPSPQNLKTRQSKLTTHILDRNGYELYKIYQDENRSLVELKQLPKHLINATVAIEDKEFWSHPGFSVSGIFRAVYQNYIRPLAIARRPDRGKNGAAISLQGGSTITQQLIKNTLLGSEKTIQRKIREVILAIRVERVFSKTAILEMYLNEVSYGGTAYGIQEAAQHYFSKNAQNLTLAEAALLAGLPAAPTIYSPFGANPELAKLRQAEVLRRMAEDGYITSEQAEQAKIQPLPLAADKTNIKAPHFVMYIRDLLVKEFGEKTVSQGGLIVTTSIDLPLQEFVQKTVFDQVSQLSGLHVTNGAVLVTKPSTGEILAMVGSKDYFDFANDGQVNVALRPRQPGSAIKPVNYAAALQRGFTPASIIFDSPITYRLPGSPSYSPINYDRRWHGKLTIRTALASSYNVPAVKILSAIGVDRMIDQGELMGIKTWANRSRFGLSLTLGGGEVTMADMAEVYGTLANYGMHIPLNPVLKITDRLGNNLPIKTLPPNRAMPPGIAYQISDILSDNAARAPAFGTHSVLNIPGHRVAVKTGTTNNLRDNWTFGYTTDYLVGAWVGNNDNSPMSYIASGITGASPIWHQITAAILKQQKPHSFSLPQDLKIVKICALTGQLACQNCPTREEFFLPGTEPKTACRPEEIEAMQKAAEVDQRDQILDGASTQGLWR